MLSFLPQFIGRSCDVEQPPYGHQGLGMRGVIYDIDILSSGEVEIVSTEGYGWRMDSETRVTMLNPEEDVDEMAFAREIRG